MSVSLVKSKFPFLLLICTLFMLLLPTAMASASVTDLNGIGTTQSPTGAVEQVQPSIPVSTEGSSTADALKAANEALGVTPQAMETANNVMSPIAYWANIGFAILLTFAFIAMFFVTGIDLVYIAFPPIRPLLLPEQPQGGGMGGMGMGGFGGGMGGGAPQQSSSKLGQWISDEAKAAVQSSQPQQSGGMGGGFGGGGFGGGGFGGGGFGGGMGGGSEPAKAKSVIVSYFKKRVIFLVLFGVCALLLSTTLFTDIGINIGTWLMNRLLGISDSIPE